MYRYYIAAIILKFFSLSHTTRRVYRFVANFKRRFLPSHNEISWKYVYRTDKFLSLLRDHNVLRDNLRVFELGTGWVHWEATIIRNEIDCTALLYDVVDNRDLQRYRRVLSEIQKPDRRAQLDLKRSATEELMREASKLSDFDSIYERLGFAYCLDPEGKFSDLNDPEFDLVLSSDVFEHLPYEDIPNILDHLYEITKPGAWAYHQIVLTDHLKMYAKSIHPKQYLAYKNEHWNRYLSNGIQYINRVQIPEWRKFISKSGFSIAEERRVGHCDLSGFAVSSEFEGVSSEDLECTVVQFLLQKPVL